MSDVTGRQVQALEGIKNYLGDLVKILTAVNQNLVTFAKIVQENEEGPSPAWAKEDKPEYVGGLGTLGEAFRTPYKKEGE